MRFVRAIAGALLLTVALPVGLFGALLASDSGRRNPGGPYRMTVEIAGLPGWSGWLLLGAGAALTLLAVGLAVRPVRPPVPPREVVLVVEPAQVPLLADRFGLPTLDGVGRSADEPLTAVPPVPAEAGPPPGGPAAPVRPKPAVPAEVAGGTAGSGVLSRPGPVRPPVPLRLAWPTARPFQEGRPVSHPPVPVSKNGRRAASAGSGAAERDPGRRRTSFRSTGKHLRDRP
ncbi:hypothetical protein [Micromonospora echinofusca]|uniref:Tryptophan-associated transmembrane protein (Trp_oprn_chp) n=1 Tax=Micromonospora echinofusca TaxID=47858 RepID=A0ABS3VXR1_MICEH|nr:hypothetical protein [Micromonospora echinofusca]MBO4209233.1 hypothetical protein [Micromonospora echinofusca]